MKKATLSLLIALSCALSYGQSITVPLFDSVRLGFNTGEFPAARFPGQVRTGDIDNDGDPDAVIAMETWNTGIKVMKNGGNGMYLAPVSYATTLAVKDITIADLNNDGLKDIAVTNTGDYDEGNSIAVFINVGSGN